MMMVVGVDDDVVDDADNNTSADDGGVDDDDVDHDAADDDDDKEYTGVSHTLHVDSYAWANQSQIVSPENQNVIISFEIRLKFKIKNDK